MIKIPVLFFVFFIITCGENNFLSTAETRHAQEDDAVKVKTAPQADTSGWIYSFRKFRTAVYQRNKDSLKSFIDFPILNDNNEIWYLVYNGNEKAIGLLPEKIKPFTERDFDLHHDKLFSKNFINALLKIKTEELYQKGSTETITLQDGKATGYKMYATFDKAAGTLSLNLASKTIIKDAGGKEQDGGEFNEIYMFSILRNGKIKFRQIRIAG